jgi:hypothetical protein
MANVDRSAGDRQASCSAVQSGNIARSAIEGPTGKRTSDEERAGWIFSEINVLAECVQRMGILLVAEGSEDPRDAAAFQCAIQALSAQIGLLADMGAELTDGLPLRGADPRRWLLPPVYKIEDAQGTSHG